MREACGDSHLKTILSTGQLASLTNVYKASMICMMAGADVIKVCAIYRLVLLGNMNAGKYICSSLLAILDLEVLRWAPCVAVDAPACARACEWRPVVLYAVTARRPWEKEGVSSATCLTTTLSLYVCRCRWLHCCLTDIHGQGSCQRHLPCRSHHASRHPRLLRAHNL